jgi:hypothetical protein
MRSRRIAQWSLGALLCGLTQACTAGYITDPNGNALSPNTAVVVELNGTQGNYSAKTWDLNGQTVFSFDPNAPSTGGNVKALVAPGDYTVTVVTNTGARYYSYGPSAALGNYTPCSESDYFTGATTKCQLLQLKIYPTLCFEGLPQPYQDGQFYVVSLGPHDCD